MGKTVISFYAGDLRLEGSLDVPSSLINPSPGVVICHPHPLYGGNMDNNVVRALSRALNNNGIAVLRFNFRGVGNSEGVFANGVGERADALAAIDYLARREEVDTDRIGIAGYSFGGLVTMGAGHQHHSVRAIAVVSPVVTPGMMAVCPKPKLVICGTADQIVSPALVQLAAAKMAEPKTVHLLKGADHFWWGQEAELGRNVADFFAKALRGREQSNQ